MIEAMRFGRIEIAYFGPFSYVLAKSKAPAIEPFAVGIERGAPTYNSMIIAQAGGPVNAVGRHQGQELRLWRPGLDVEPSDSARLAAQARPRRQQGLQGRHLGTHDAVARAVQNGQVQAGALSKAIFETLVARKVIDDAKLKVIATADPIPNYPMVMQGNLDPELKERSARHSSS